MPRPEGGIAAGPQQLGGGRGDGVEQGDLGRGVRRGPGGRGRRRPGRPRPPWASGAKSSKTEMSKPIEVAARTSARSSGVKCRSAQRAGRRRCGARSPPPWAGRWSPRCRSGRRGCRRSAVRAAAVPRPVGRRARRPRVAPLRVMPVRHGGRRGVAAAAERSGFRLERQPPAPPRRPGLPVRRRRRPGGWRSTGAGEVPAEPLPRQPADRPRAARQLGRRQASPGPRACRRAVGRVVGSAGRRPSGSRMASRPTTSSSERGRRIPTRVSGPTPQGGAGRPAASALGSSSW